MAESPRRVDLRLTIPASAPYREIAVDLAVRFAEYAGASPAAVADVPKAVAAAVGPPDRRRAVDLVLTANAGTVTVTTSPPD